MELCLIRRPPVQGPTVGDIDGGVQQALAVMNKGEEIKPGDSVAITADSRGLARYREVVRSVVGWVRERGGEPFLVPSMGSHGGGTVAGRMARELIRDWVAQGWLTVKSDARKNRRYSLSAVYRQHRGKPSPGLVPGPDKRASVVRPKNFFQASPVGAKEIENVRRI